MSPGDLILLYRKKRFFQAGKIIFKTHNENLAKERGKKLFNADYINVQPHSGSQANMAVYLTFLKPGDTVMGLNLAHGGHLTHGSQVNFSGQLYNFVSYNVSRNNGLVNFEEVMKIAQECNPKLIICGGSAYPRFIEFNKFKKVADKVGAYLMADIAHPSGLIASGIHPSPWPFCDVVTSTTHKTLRGPRGGIILVGKDLDNNWNIVAPKSGRIKKMSELIDSAVMPGIQGGPLMHVIAGKAVAFKEALSPNFTSYCKQVVSNAATLANTLLDLGYKLVSGGTDTHLILIDCTSLGITGRKAQNALEGSGIIANRNTIPYDERSPFVTSGLRIGTPALTSRGMGSDEMKKLSSWIIRVLSDPDGEDVREGVRNEVTEFAQVWPAPSGE